MRTDDSSTSNGDTSGKAVAPKTPASESLTEANRLSELRERLYSRGATPNHAPRHSIPPRTIPSEGSSPTPRVQDEQVSPAPQEISLEKESPRSAPENKDEAPVGVSYTGIMASQKRKSVRKIIALASVVFFVLAIGISSLIMFSGNNVISGDNIEITATGPIAVGGGEELSFQVSVANQNAVPIQFATLIIEYPRGTQSSSEPNKEILIERRSLDEVKPGELVNVELKARIFGEENEEKEIKVSIEYRVSGSNATFEKEATPLKFKVSTSPVIVSIDTLKSISSGQEIELTYIVQSNSPTPLKDVLVKATYPQGFDFSGADPDTISGEDTWKIDSLEPAQKKIITVKGLVTGYEADVLAFNGAVGVAGTNDKNALASIFTTAEAKVTVEQPFLKVNVAINGNQNETVIVNTDEVASIEISYKNELNSAIYDGQVLVELDGNALNEFDINSSEGFYDSSKNTISWDSVDEDSLKEILPGRTSSVSFTLSPDDSIGKAPEIKLKVTVKGLRRFENNVSGELIGTAERVVKVESIPTIQASVIYGSGPFTNTGPVPPIAETMTQYTFALSVQSGANDVTGAEVTAVLPPYVQWLDLVSDGDIVTYTASTRTLKWSIGDMDANAEENVAVQVSFLPSKSQVNTSPTLLESPRFKATDRFTGTTVRSEHPAITTSLFYEGDEGLKDGTVRREE